MRVDRLSDPRRVAGVGVLACASALLAALGFQHLGGLAPCPLCILQRWPHGIALVFGLAAIAWPGRALRVATALAASALTAGAVIAFYHAGVEQGWWPGPDTCAVPDPSSMSTDDLLARLQATPVVRCDEIPWSFLGLSMAAWNVPLSLGIAGLFAYASSSASQYR
jgi:disulfide bond formation protein DsbB